MMQITRELFDELVDEGFNVRDDYSGCGMYGRTCFGITGNVSDLVRFILFVAESAIERPDLMIDSFADIRTDSMGLDTIFYWPRVQVLEGDENDG